MSSIRDIIQVCNIRAELGISCSDCVYRGPDCARMQRYYRIDPIDKTASRLLFIDSPNEDREAWHSLKIHEIRRYINNESISNNAIDNIC